MKKLPSMLFAFFVIALVASIFIIPSKANSSGPVKRSIPSAGIPDSIHKILEKACMDCHANDGNAMAKGRVNFSKWDTYKPEKQAAKAKAICKVITKGSMPPKGFRKNHPEAIPTQAETDAICKWAGTLNQ